MAYTKVHTSRSNINNTWYCQQTKCIKQGHEEEHDQQSTEVVNEDNRQKNINTPGDKVTIPQKGKIIKTTSR